MNVLALTIFVGFLLVGFFVILWIATACDPRSFNERDALLPLEPDSTPSRKSDHE
ncbi:MAG: hypothetical protein ABJF10_06435 [Chthoniobacter sp.]|uniref:hypothetical protein n=1 Tax=Chthoniobacter sp. TaxID=2510640 RepID=UPI0032A4A4F6